MPMLEKKNISKKLLCHNLFCTILVLSLSTIFALILVEASSIQNNVFGVYVLAVAIISSMTTGYHWGVIASVAGVIGVNYFFTFPYFAINFTMTGYPLTFLIMLVISSLTSALTAKIKKQALIASAREKRTKALYDINKQLLVISSMDNIVKLMLDYFKDLYQGCVIYYYGDPADSKTMEPEMCPVEARDIFFQTMELIAAHGAYTEKTKTGRGTDLFSSASVYYIPIFTQDTIYGVVGFYMNTDELYEEENNKFLEVVISQFTLAMERQNLSDKAQEIRLETEKEKIRSDLLRSVSHDLRTPLTCILGSSTTLLENKDIAPETHDKLLYNICDDSKWLIHMVENLLAITRISEETATVKKQMEAVEEVVAEAVGRVRKSYDDREILVKIPDEFLMVPMDATLIEQVLINFMENAIRHSHSMEAISVFVYPPANGWVTFEVIDQGIGINDIILPHIFDGYNHLKDSDSTRGIGLGLSICKSIILAHGGKIMAENSPNGGAVFRFLLSLKGENDHDE